MQRIAVYITNDCDGNQPNYNNDLPAIENNNYALQKPCGNFFDSNRQRKTRTSFVISLVAFDFAL